MAPVRLMMYCPTTGEAVPTGVELHEGSPEVEGHAVDGDRLLGPCPSCGRAHLWRPRDAWTEDAS